MGEMRVYTKLFKKEKERGNQSGNQDITGEARDIERVRDRRYSNDNKDEQKRNKSSNTMYGTTKQGMTFECPR